MPRNLDDRSTALYRLTDTDGRLLYVGITTDPEERFRQHASTSPWWPLVAHREIAWHATRPAAEKAEATAIEEETPLYNRAGSSRPQTLTEAFPVAREVSTAQLRVRLADVVHAAAIGGETTYVTKHGRRIAALVPLADAEAHEAKRLRNAPA